MDWGAWNSLTKNTADYRGISDEELAYINKHLHSYSDQGKDLTSWDGHGGIIPYGKVFTVEGKHHNAGLPKIKGNSLDIKWYVKKGLFCSGMTEKQVREIAKRKAKAAEKFDLSKLETWFDSTDPESYVKEYLEKYGSFAPEPSMQELLTLKRRRIDELHASLRTSSGDKKISLREELVRVSAETTKLQAEVYEEEIKLKIESEKEKVSQKISSLKSEAYSIARHLPSSEVEVLLSELSLDTAWNSGKETKTITAASDYKNKMSQISDNLNKVADRIIESDQIGAKFFSN
mgnify:CR=1 FL=1